MVLKIPIGITDFRQIIEENFYYIDKTLFIDELERSNGQVLLIPRPRRFGKTLNLSMLKYFYEKSSNSNAHLFEGTAIWKITKQRKLQGTFPVIFLSFKDCKDSSLKKVISDLKEVIVQEFRRHYDELESSLNVHDHEDYKAIMTRQANDTIYTASLTFLSRLLKQKYKKRVFVLIDEYDAPIHAAYTHGFYIEVVDFIRSLLSGALKDNSNLKRGILTGILRTGKESIFSGLNNLKVHTVLDTKFSDFFGFTSNEVDMLLKDAGLSNKSSLIKDWYNSYRCGKKMLYNPWSLLECIDNDGILDAYWANTSDNELIKKLIAQADETVKAELELLLKNKVIEKEIDSGLIFPGIEHNPKALWSLLLFAGYLTFNHIKRIEETQVCSLILPNEEIKRLYRSLISSIIESSLSGSKIQHLKESLIHGNTEIFANLLQEFIMKSMSIYDISSDEPERGYHLFVLGLLVILSDTYAVQSNKESGFGRYDIMLIPHNKTQFGYIIEFKKVATSQESFEKTAQTALDQIEKKHYAQELVNQGIKKIIVLGIACKGKKIVMKTAYKD